MGQYLSDTRCCCPNCVTRSLLAAAYSEDPEARPLLGPDVEKIRFAFKVFRDRCIQMKKVHVDNKGNCSQVATGTDALQRGMLKASAVPECRF